MKSEREIKANIALLKTLLTNRDEIITKVIQAQIIALDWVLMDKKV